MAKPSNPKLLPLRLREAIAAAGLTQERLGVLAGIPPEVASTRVNRYIRGTSEPDEETVRAIAQVLGVPVASLYADSPLMAQVIRDLASLPAREQKRVADELQALAQEKGRKKPTG